MNKEYWQAKADLCRDLALIQIEEEETEKEDVFTATFQVDDPRFVPLEDHCALQLQQKVDVSMLARYYPFSAYEESRPKYADRYNMQDDGGAEERGTGVVEPVVYIIQLRH